MSFPVDFHGTQILGGNSAVMSSQTASAVIHIAASSIGFVKNTFLPPCCETAACNSISQLSVFVAS